MHNITVPELALWQGGHEISQGLTAALRALGIDARHLEGGIAAWREADHPVERTSP